METQALNKMAKNSSSTSEVFGSFFLGDCEFALSVKFVQEVVVPPTSYSTLPLSPNYLIGLFNLRGIVIPVVDLKILFKISSTPVQIEQRIAIVEINGFRVGLLFDNTGEIFRSLTEERNDFNEETENNLISGVFKKDEGRRILQILNVPGILDLKNIPKQHNEADQNQLYLAKKRGQRKNCISFLVGPSKCALGISEIQEILKVDQINKTILNANHCIGTINLRGTTVPVIDFAAHFGFREADKNRSLNNGNFRIIVMKFGDELFGLLVDAVDSIISYFADELVSFPAINNGRAEMFLGCILGKEKTEILLLDALKIFKKEELSDLTQGHSSLYKAEQHSRQMKSIGLKKTYISFNIENLYAVGIDEVREIIDCPEKLLQPPGLPSHFKGILNLRNELVNIVDARAMYKLPDRAGQGQGQGKILIFKKQSMHFGLIVDSVEAIVSFSESDKMKVPEILYKDGSKGLGDDVSEAVLLKSGSDQEFTLFLVNVNSIFERLHKQSAA